MTTLITGAAGFVGRNLCQYLAPRHLLRLAVRELPAAESLRSFGEVVASGHVCGTTDWSESLRGVHAVVHLANRAHITREDAADPVAAYREVNVEGTRHLAEQAAAAGVRRLVYLSSVKVLGERTQSQVFSETSSPAPEDPLRAVQAGRGAGFAGRCGKDGPGSRGAAPTAGLWSGCRCQFSAFDALGGTGHSSAGGGDP